MKIGSEKVGDEPRPKTRLRRTGAMQTPWKAIKDETRENWAALIHSYLTLQGCLQAHRIKVASYTGGSFVVKTWRRSRQGLF